MTALTGIITSMPTPFDGAGAVDADALTREVGHQVRSGVHGICVLGGTGEFFSLDAGERMRVVEATVAARREAGAEGPLVVGNFLRDESEWLEFAGAAWSLGADAVMLAPAPFYNVNARQFRAFLERVAPARETPVVIFNTPGRSGVRLGSGELVDTIRAIPGVVGVKDSTGDLSMLSAVSRAVGGECSLLQGHDDLYVPSRSVGCVGGILAMASIFPDVFARMEAAWAARRIEAARALQFALLPVLDVVGLEPMPVLVKAAMAIVGHPVGSVRSPLCPETPETRRALEAAIGEFEGECDRLAA